MNLFQAFGALLLITGIIVGLMMWANSDGGGALTYLIELWLPLLCVAGGIGLLVKGTMYPPPTKRRGSASSSRNSGKKSKSRKKKK